MRKALLVLFLCFMFPCMVFAQVDINVYDDTVYEYLAKLASAKLIRTYSPNQRPLTRYAVAKMVVEASDRVKDTDTDYLRSVIGELEELYRTDVELIRENRNRTFDYKILDKVQLSWTGTSQPEEPMPGNGLGSTNGKVQPLLAYKDGQHYEKYNNNYFDISLWASATPYFSSYLQPQLYYTSGDVPNGAPRLYRGYIKTGFKNIELQIGRDDVFWGPGKYPLLFSNNARAQDMIRLSTPHTFRLPWVLKHLGQWRFSTFFSLMDFGSYEPPNTILSAYRIDYQPFHWWTIGFDHAVEMGGKGSVTPSVKTAIGEYIGFLFDSGNSRASSNHMMGFDMTFRILPLMGMELYGKVLLEDTQKEYYYMLINDANWLGGIYFPRIGPVEKLSLRTEFVYSGQFSYRHSFYSDGWSLDGKFIGYDAGSDTYSGLVESIYRFNIDEFVGGAARYLFRSSNTYNLTFDASGNNNGIVVATRGIDEQHFIVKAMGQKRLSKMINLYGELGLDGTKNKEFIGGNNKVDFAAQVKFVFHDLVK